MTNQPNPPKWLIEKITEILMKELGDLLNGSGKSDKGQGEGIGKQSSNPSTSS